MAGICPHGVSKIWNCASCEPTWEFILLRTEQIHLCYEIKMSCDCGQTTTDVRFLRNDDRAAEVHVRCEKCLRMFVGHVP